MSIEKCCHTYLKNVSFVIQSRNFSNSVYLLKKEPSHYDTLGVTPKATVGDIKNAYYNLSMIYHPDKSGGSPEALEKFRAVKNAYEVLSNVNSKKLYDRGVGHSPPVKKSPSNLHPKKKTYVPQEVGRTPIYNFELWSRAHYGETIARRTDAKKKYSAAVAAEETDEEHNKGIVVVTAFMLVAIVTAMLQTVHESKLMTTPDAEKKASS